MPVRGKQLIEEEEVNKHKITRNILQVEEVVRDEKMAKVVNVIANKFKENPKWIQPALRLFAATQRMKPDVAERNTKEIKFDSSKNEKRLKTSEVESRRSRSFNGCVEAGEYSLKSESRKRLSAKEKTWNKNGRKEKTKVKGNGSAEYKETNKNVSLHITRN